jgi:1,2-diacylglycerol 3-beta-glucosyltransferase
MIVLTILVGAVAALLLLPTLSDLISIPPALRRRATDRQTDGEAFPALLFLVPAHNEELLIESCVASLLDLDYPAERRRIVVIADNCTDRTAALVRQAGAEALERTDASRRGKPHALAWALERIRLDDFDAVVIADADSVIDRAFAKAMAAHAPLRERAIQGMHGIRNPRDSPMTRMGALLSTVLYRYMYPLRSRAGLSVPLTGSGMCIGTSILRTRGWRAFSIAEDTELYVDLTRGGKTVEIEPAAVVRSQEARDLQQGKAQRTRWRAGRLDILRRLGPEVLRAKELGLHQRLDMLAELIAPGPLVHLGVALVLGIVIWILQPPGASLLLLLLGLPIVRLAVYTLLALRDEPEPLRTAATFFYLPVYLVWRMGTELTALASHQDGRWVRTERHAEEQGTEP